MIYNYFFSNANKQINVKYAIGGDEFMIIVFLKLNHHIWVFILLLTNISFKYTK